MTREQLIHLNKERYFLTQELYTACDCYAKGQSSMSNILYDAKLRELKRLEALTGNTETDSPTQREGYELKVREERKVTRTDIMPSMKKIKDHEQLLSWLKKHLTTSHIVYVHPKYDGIAVSIEYRNGRLFRASTRGDGFVGQDITHIVSRVSNIPLTSPFAEVRGELIVNKKAFKYIKQDTEFKTPRNYAAGLANCHEIPLRNILSFVAYAYRANSDSPIEYSFDAHSSDFTFQKLLIAKLNNLKISKKEITELYEMEKDDEWPIDGLVFRAEDLVDSSKSILVAFKFAGNAETTEITNIIHQVGRTGKITPVAVFNPIEIGGVVIEKCTLHNIEYVIEKDIQIGDIVLIERAGDVIPKIKDVVLRRDIIRYEAPEQCPGCWALLLDHQCCNPAYCYAQLQARLVHWCARDNMNIKGLGIKNIKYLMHNHHIRTPVDLYIKLKDVTWPGKLWNDIMLELEKSKNQPLHRLLTALSIPGLGTVEAKTFTNIADLAYRYPEWYESPHNKNIIERLIALGFNTEKTHESTKPRVVITGVLSRPRHEYENFLIENGFDVLKSITKMTDYLIIGDNPGNTKLTKAEKYGIKTISEFDLLNLIEN